MVLPLPPPSFQTYIQFESPVIKSINILYFPTDAVNTIIMKYFCDYLINLWIIIFPDKGFLPYLVIVSLVFSRLYAVHELNNHFRNESIDFMNG